MIAATSVANCSGTPCPGGFYCLAGTTSSTVVTNPSSLRMDLAGERQIKLAPPHVCPLGLICGEGLASDAFATECPPGMWCEEGTAALRDDGSTLSSGIQIAQVCSRLELVILT